MTTTSLDVTSITLVLFYQGVGLPRPQWTSMFKIIHTDQNTPSHQGPNTLTTNAHALVSALLHIMHGDHLDRPDDAQKHWQATFQPTVLSVFNARLEELDIPEVQQILDRLLRGEEVDPAPYAQLFEQDLYGITLQIVHRDD